MKYEGRPFRGLVICESPTSSFHYHLREVPEDGPQLGGAPGGKALCEAPIGWDTQIRLHAWGRKDHLPSRYCSSCEQIAIDMLSQMEGPDRVSGNLLCKCGKEAAGHPEALLYRWQGEQARAFCRRLCDGRVVKT